jgi:predicted kinase
MSKVYVLVGVPGAGKTTWINQQNWLGDAVIVSTDNYVERFAKKMDKTYSEVFDLVMPRAVRLMCRKVIQAREKGVDIVWDQTSTSVLSRRRKFFMLPDYEHVAIVFKTPPWPELKQRLDSRPGKHVPRKIVKSMISNFEMPTEAEGYREIWRAE